jgi:hypothetical protein
VTPPHLSQLFLPLSLFLSLPSALAISLAHDLPLWRAACYQLSAAATTAAAFCRFLLLLLPLLLLLRCRSKE